MCTSVCVHICTYTHRCVKIDSVCTNSYVLQKKQLAEAIRSRKMSVMHPKFAIAYTGQARWKKSFYSKWLQTDQPIQTFYRDQWEPYYIARLPVPTFDERFSDRGFNKAQQQFLLSWYVVLCVLCLVTVSCTGTITHMLCFLMCSM